MSQLQVTGEAKIRDIQGPVVANDGVITALDGAASQYVRGDGTLADFPTSGGGGSSVSYYLNGSVNQGTFGGSTYYQMSKNAIVGTGTNFSTSANGLIAQFITDANDPDVVSIPSGNWNIEFFMSVSASSGSLASFYVEFYKYDGSTFTLLATNSATPEFLTNTTTVDAYFTSVAMPLSAMAVTDRLAVRVFANVASKTVTLYTEDNRLCQVVTTFSNGLTSLNNLTDQSQYLTTGTSGTNFAIVSSGDTHTFNLPIASASNTGKLSSTDWSTFNNKQNALTNPITGTGASGNVAYFDGTTSITSENSFNYDASTNRLGVNTTVPNATIGANAGTDSGYSLLLKNDNANYNSIGFGTDSTYGNLIQADRTGAAPSRNLTLYNYAGFISLTEAGNLGVGLLTPNTGIDIYNSTTSSLWLHNDATGVTGTDGVRLALFSNKGANLRNFDGSFSIASEGDFTVLTLGAENIRVNSADGKVGIGNPATVSEMLTVNGSIQQSGVLSSMLKTNSSGKIIAAVAGTDYLAPSSLSGYVPTSRTLTINGTAYDLSADRSWTVGTMGGSGVDGRVAYYDGTNSITSESGFIYDSSSNRLGVNTNSPNATIGSNAGLDSNYSLLLKNSDTNYNGLGFRIDSTYGHMIETTRTGSAIARNLTMINNGGFFSVSEAGNFGFNILAVNTGVDIYASTNAQLWLHNGANTGSTQGARLAYFSNKSLNLRNFEGPLSLSSEGDFFVLTLGAENIRVNSANGYVGIGNPTTLTTIFTVNGAITQSSVTSALLKTDGSGTLVAAVAGTDYVVPSALSSYVPTSRTLTINGTTYDLSANRSWTIATGVTGSGTTDYIPKFTGSTSIGNSAISEDATFVTLNSRALSAPRARFNTAYDNASLSLNIAGQTYMDSRSSRLYQTFNLNGISNYMHIYDPFTTVNANGGFSIGSSSSITLLPSTSIIHFDGVNSRVGIGTTSPVKTLEVRGTIAISNSSSSYWYMDRDDSDGRFKINTDTDNERFTITTGGNVGIGTSSPDGRLTIKQANSLDYRGLLVVDSATPNWIALAHTGSAGVISVLYDGAGSFTPMVFKTSDTERMRITSGGDVLINGTSNTYASKVVIEGNANLLTLSRPAAAKEYGFQISSGGAFTIRDYTGTADRLLIFSGGQVAINRGDAGGGAFCVKGFSSASSANAMFIQNSSDAELFSIRNDGLIRTGTAATSPYNNSTSGRTMVIESSGGLGYTSSTRESKTNIQQLSNVSWLYQLNPVSFNYRKKDDEMNYTDEFNDEKWYGLIADEVEKVNEDLVFYNIKEDGTKQLAGVEYNKLIAALIKSSQEQQAQIEELSNKIVALESK
jgi:predicted heme/steroid binding protein